MDKICTGIEELPVAAEEFVNEMEGKSVYAFYGEMGAGKTTFISEICRRLGCKDVVTSPTFSIVNEYIDSTGRPVYHFDFYRIEDVSEAADIGLDDYFTSGYPCLIEWPERIATLLPQDAVSVRITELPSGARKITTDIE